MYENIYINVHVYTYITIYIYSYISKFDILNYKENQVAPQNGMDIDLTQISHVCRSYSITSSPTFYSIIMYTISSLQKERKKNNREKHRKIKRHTLLINTSTPKIGSQAQDSFSRTCNRGVMRTRRRCINVTRSRKGLDATTVVEGLPQ